MKDQARAELFDTLTSFDEEWCSTEEVAAVDAFEAAVRAEERVTADARWAGRAVADVLAEVERGVARFGDGSMSGTAMTDLERYPVLAEEVGEVAEALVLRIADGTYRAGREHHADDLRSELVQVAACAIGWVTAIDNRAALLPASPGPQLTDEVCGEPCGWNVACTVNGRCEVRGAHITHRHLTGRGDHSWPSR